MKDKKKLDNSTRASVKKEMAKPRPDNRLVPEIQVDNFLGHLRLREHQLISGPTASVHLEVRAALRPHARRWTGAGHSMFSPFPYRRKAWPRARRRIGRVGRLGLGALAFGRRLSS